LLTILDASGTGYGGYIVETPITHGMWLDSEKMEQFYMERTHCCETGVIVCDSYIVG
jgi:hypothetical protein